MKKAAHSRFAEKAIRWRVLDQTVQGIKDRNQDLPPEQLQEMIDRAVRDERSRKSRRAR